MSGKTRYDFRPHVELAQEPEFRLGQLIVRPSASEVAVGAVTRRIEPRVMQALVALVQANEAVVSRDELMARCWTGMVVSEDAVTRAVGQVRRLSYLAPASFTVETIPKIGYRLVRAGTLQATADAAALAVGARTSRVAASIAFAAVVGLTVIAGGFGVALSYSLPSPAVESAEQSNPLGSQNAEARDRHLRATALFRAGGRDNTQRAEQLLREALELDPSFHGARETLIVTLMSAVTFAPERAAETYGEIADLLDDEIVETPLVWRAYVMRGFQYAFEGDWVAAERSLAKARGVEAASAAGALGALEIFLLGNVGRISDSFALVARQAQAQPLALNESQGLQQWLDRLGKHEEAEGEYVRSRDLPGDRSSMEMAALVRALGGRDPERIAEHFRRYRETGWGRSGDHALSAVQADSSAALSLLRQQIEGYRHEGAMPPFLAAAWASYYGDYDLAVKGLRASPQSLFSRVGSIWDPVFTDTRRTDAFKTFLRDFGFVEYWRAQNDWGDFCRPLRNGDFECR
jgi:DNA-binding winged helix-turn-helix (wHTH) protein/tetratricopeptide (TPR) repeat protein